MDVADFGSDEPLDGELEMNDRLKQAFEQLTAALNQPQVLDAQALATLKELVVEIERVLQAKSDEPSANKPSTDEQASDHQNAQSSEDHLTLSGLGSRLQGWIEQQEAEYPEWAKIVSMIAERLSDMGI